MRVVVATRPVDFRKGHDGLAAVVEQELRLNPYSGVAVVFRPKRLDRMKVRWWDGTGAGVEAARAGPLCLAGGARRASGPRTRGPSTVRSAGKDDGKEMELEGV